MIPNYATYRTKAQQADLLLESIQQQEAGRNSRLRARIPQALWLFKYTSGLTSPVVSSDHL